jgi:ADP-dependent NAD(P)H-hydrate dehydratase / NAD(P)H-hydrate epimerase
MSTMHPVSDTLSNPLYDVATSRLIEQALATQQAPHALMAAAGLAVAQLARAIAPHARQIWVACGPGNNGGDGLVAATWLHEWGHEVTVILSTSQSKAPDDARWALGQAKSAGVPITPVEHDLPPAAPDLIIDALLGIGANRAPEGTMAKLILHLNRLQSTHQMPVLAVDVPSGLLADTGSVAGNLDEPLAIKASHTLSLVTLRPGLFTALGRDLCGQVWFEDLGANALIASRAKRGTHWPNKAALTSRPEVTSLRSRRHHNSHKGSWGDIAVVGGAIGTQGAAVLAATAALHAGAGRVWLSLLGLSQGSSHPNAAERAPSLALALPADLMQQPWQNLNWSELVVVAGCGGGIAIAEALPQLLQQCNRLVLDADALNVLAKRHELQALLTHRHRQGQTTILSPHPKEAARLLSTSVDGVQQDRLSAARSMAEQFQCTVVLKGSGTIVASPGNRLTINPTGNGLLAIAGTGDVLAGMLGTALAHDDRPFEAAQKAAYHHGALADGWPTNLSLTAGDLARSIAPLA